MADAVKIEIVSPEKLLLSEDVQSVTVPGTEGYFTVMGEHAPTMAVLKPGFVTVTGGETPGSFYVRGGFVEVGEGTVTILAEDARTAKDFDRAEIEAAIAEARKVADAAQSIEDKDAAQLVVDSLVNLMSEVEHMGPALTTAL